jgi:anti-sigma factor RsiW
MSEAIGTHPDETLTAAYLDGTLPEGKRDRFEEHLAACDPCRAGVALLARPSHQEPPLEMVERARRGRMVRSRSHRPALLAAAAMVAVAGALWLRGALIPSAPPPPGARGPESELSPVSPPAGAVVDAGAIAFVWSAVRGADRYVVTVQDAQGRTIATIESRTAGDPIRWPEGTAVPAPGTYLWSVRALALDRVVAESRPLAFQVP